MEQEHSILSMFHDIGLTDLNILECVISVLLITTDISLT